MSAPVNTGRIIAHFKNRESVVSNDTILKLAGGKPDQWYPSLRGHMVSIAIRSCNEILRDEGLAISSEGIRSEQWQLMSCHEANLREMRHNLSRVDAHFKNAIKSIEAIAYDHRAPKSLRGDAVAWLELMKERRSENGLSLLKEFAIELTTEAGQHQLQPRLRSIQ